MLRYTTPMQARGTANMQVANMHTRCCSRSTSSSSRAPCTRHHAGAPLASSSTRVPCPPPQARGESRPSEQTLAVISMFRSAATAALAAAVLLAGTAAQPAQAMLPPGKRAVTAAELVEIVKEDFTQRKYLVTGNLTKEVYSDKCHFADARDDFGNIGPDAWARAVGLLFNGEKSRLKLTGDVVLDEAARTITFTSWRQVDVFRLPGDPHTPVYTGHTTLTLDPVENLVTDHIESWDVKPDEVTKAIKFFDGGFNPAGFD